MYASLVFPAAAALLVNQAVAGYTLEDDYNSGNWNSMFDYFTSADPTNGKSITERESLSIITDHLAGFVDYVSESVAQSDGFFEANGGSIYMGVDHTNVASSAGRDSIRITSNKSYNKGLFILDLTVSICVMNSLNPH